jgi:threonine synthase
MKLRQSGEIDADERIVCICTGNLLKDPDTVIKSSGKILKSKANMEAVKRLISI